MRTFSCFTMITYDCKSCNYRDLFNKVSCLSYFGGDFLEPRSGQCREYTACIRDWCKNQGLLMHCEFEINTHYYQSNVFRHEIRQVKPVSKIFPSV